MNDESSKYRAVYVVAADGISDSGHQLYTIHQARVPNAHNWKLFVSRPAEQPRGEHPDDAAVDSFAAALKAKLAEARAKGRAGWNNDEQGMQQRLSNMLRAHVEKGDPRDVGNFAMFLHQRGESVLPYKPQTMMELRVAYGPEAREAAQPKPEQAVGDGVDLDDLQSSLGLMLTWLETLAQGKELRPDADTHAFHPEADKTKFRKAGIASAKANASAFIPTLRKLWSVLYDVRESPRPAVATPAEVTGEKSEVWVVQDEMGQPVFCAGWPQACHEHINDAINEHGIVEAKAWKVLHYSNSASPSAGAVVPEGYALVRTALSLPIANALGYDAKFNTWEEMQEVWSNALLAAAPEVRS